MAKIKIRKNGLAPVAVLTELDRLKLSSGIDEYCKIKDISFTQLAKDMGISRQLLYGLLKADQIELQRLILLQQKISVWVINKLEIEKYLRQIEHSLTPKGEDSEFKRFDDYIENEIAERSFKISTNVLYVWHILRHISTRIWYMDRFLNLLSGEFSLLYDGKDLDYEYLPDQLYDGHISESNQELFDVFNSQNIYPTLISRYLELSIVLTSFEQYMLDWDYEQFRKDAPIGQAEKVFLSHGDKEYPGLVKKAFFLDINFDIKNVNHYIDVPILGTNEMWTRYEQVAQELMKSNKNLSKNFQDYHNKFMKNVKEHISTYEEDLKEIDEYCADNNRLTRFEVIDAGTARRFLDRAELNTIATQNAPVIIFDIPNKVEDLTDDHLEILLKMRDKSKKFEKEISEILVSSGWKLLEPRNRIGGVDFIACKKDLKVLINIKNYHSSERVGTNKIPAYNLSVMKGLKKSQGSLGATHSVLVTPERLNNKSLGFAKECKIKAVVLEEMTDLYKLLTEE